MNDDLQTFLKDYENQFPSDVLRIRKKVPRDYLTTAAVLEIEKQDPSPVLIFEQVEGSSWPIVTGLFSSKKRIAHMLGVTPEHLHEHWIKVSEHLIPPEIVNDSVCQEVITKGDQVDLGADLPLMRHFLQDAGRYLTSGVVVAKDPDTGVGNLSFVRMQLKGKRKFGISMHSKGHQWDYFRRAEQKGQGLEVAVVIGCHPAFLIGAASRVPADVDEYDVVGALLGHPLGLVPAVSVDLPVPARAEIVLEGVIEPDIREAEGPFSEYTGYVTGRSTQNVLRINTVTHRKNPWFLDICPGASRDHLFLSRVQREAENLRRLRQVFSNVKAIHYPVSGTHFTCYLSIDKNLPGDARQAALLLLGIDPYTKWVVVVDEDIDVQDEGEVLWAIATRMQPKENTFVIDDINCNRLDPSSKDGLSSKIVMDATKPMDWKFERCSVSEEIRQKALSILKDEQ